MSPGRVPGQEALFWSEGAAELQLRDCHNLVAVNRAIIYRGYLDRWAAPLGVATSLEELRAAH